MKRAIVAAVMALSLLSPAKSSGAPLRFEKVSDHCYYLRLSPGGSNVAAIVTDDGILMMDPPSEPDLTTTLEALKRLSSKAVRWIVFSNPRSASSAGARLFAEQGAALLAGTQLHALASAGGIPAELSSFPWLIFDRQIQLFPSNLEIRVIALQHRARTGGDVVVFVPGEKVLFTGEFYEAARYPDIDKTLKGNAGQWVDGLKEVVDSVPVLKQAITRAKTDLKIDSKEEPEKTLEEGITVVSARGEVSNFQNMKDLLSACQRLRADMSKTIKGGRTCEGYLASPRADVYRSYGNFDSYAAQLCEEIRD